MSCDVISYVLSVSLGPQQLVQLFSCVDQVVLYVWTQFTLIPFDVDLSNLTRQAITEIRRFLHGGRPPTSRVLIVSGCFIAGICALSRAFLLFGISNWTLDIWKENTTRKKLFWLYWIRRRKINNVIASFTDKKPIPPAADNDDTRIVFV